ncbi:tryptophan transporter [Aciduricibacillus chroicocephali]|uniref:tryptophan transporter n=1 Tax=Aciduricibacillus chroicocephali TaxID=3054939 RepID=UPI003266222F
MKLNIRVLVMLALLIGIGTVLHAVMPPIFGVKPDMLLAMMFLGIIMFPRPQYVLLIALLAGAMSALTTQVPGGQIANMIDKPITAFAFLGLYLIIRKMVRGPIAAPVLTAVGTMISGSIFVSVVVFILASIPVGFTALFVGVVLPATLVNTVVMIVLYPVVQSIMKRSRLSTAA